MYGYFVLHQNLFSTNMNYRIFFVFHLLYINYIYYKLHSKHFSYFFMIQDIQMVVVVVVVVVWDLNPWKESGQVDSILVTSVLSTTSA